MCLVETEIFLLMILNSESYRGDFQFWYTLAFRLPEECGGAQWLLFVTAVETIEPENVLRTYTPYRVLMRASRSLERGTFAALHVSF